MIARIILCALVLALALVAVFNILIFYQPYFCRKTQLVKAHCPLPQPVKIPAHRLRVMVYITTHMSPMHTGFLENCWPSMMSRVDMFQSAEVLVFATPANRSTTQMRDYKTFLSRVFDGHNLTVLYRTNPGYQQGAMLALLNAIEYDWFSGYDWVVRLNPDVLVRSDRWITKTMATPGVDGIFVDCEDSSCPNSSRCVQARIHTDFFIIRPQAVAGKPLLSTLRKFTNAERMATFLFRPIVNKGHDRWIPGTKQSRYCRVRGLQSPVVHDHEGHFLKHCSFAFHK